MSKSCKNRKLSTKKRAARAKLLFCLLTFGFFWRSRCRRRRWILKSLLKNAWNQTPRVMTSLLVSSLPISILHQLFRCRYSNSRDVVASSSSFFGPAAKALRRACSQATKLLVTHGACYPYYRHCPPSVEITATKSKSGKRILLQLWSMQ